MEAILARRLPAATADSYGYQGELNLGSLGASLLHYYITLKIFKVALVKNSRTTGRNKAMCG